MLFSFDRKDFIVKLTTKCNIRCHYCYHFFSDNINKNLTMSKETVSQVIREVISYNKKETNFIWHGGEPLLMGKNFFDFIISEQNKYNKKNLVIRNSIQTNGILLDDEWIDFFIKNDFHLGISLDGYFENHVKNRNITNEQYLKILKNIYNLQNKNARFGILCVVSPALIGNELKLINFFIENNIYNIGFLPQILSKNRNIDIQNSIMPLEYGKFLCDFFKVWINSNETRLIVREFDEYFRSKLKIFNKLCTNSNSCANYMTVFPNGDVFLCDCFEQSTENKLGNICEGVYNLNKSVPLKLIKRISKITPNKCKSCEYVKFCNGGCKYFRFLNDKNYLMPQFYCDSFYMLYRIIDETMKENF